MVFSQAICVTFSFIHSFFFFFLSLFMYFFCSLIIHKLHYLLSVINPVRPGRIFYSLKLVRPDTLSRDLGYKSSLLSCFTLFLSLLHLSLLIFSRHIPFSSGLPRGKSLNKPRTAFIPYGVFSIPLHRRKRLT